MEVIYWRAPHIVAESKVVEFKETVSSYDSSRSSEGPTWIHHESNLFRTSCIQTFGTNNQIFQAKVID